jgi:cytochrome c biogenesis protein CcdA
MALSLWETISHYFMGSDLVPRPPEVSIKQLMINFFWSLVLWVGFPAYLYYLSQDVDNDRLLKVMGAIVSIVLIYYVIIYLLWMYSGTNIVFLRYTLGSLIGFSGLLFLGLLLFLARRGRHYNEVGGRRRY